MSGVVISASWYFLWQLCDPNSLLAAVAVAPRLGQCADLACSWFLQVLMRQRPSVAIPLTREQLPL